MLEDLLEESSDKVVVFSQWERMLRLAQFVVRGTLEEREVWLEVTIKKRGNGITHTTRPWSVDQSMPRSVIIHALPTAENGTAGARLACIDLDGN